MPSPDIESGRLWGSPRSLRTSLTAEHESGTALRKTQKVAVPDGTSIFNRRVVSHAFRNRDRHSHRSPKFPFGLRHRIDRHEGREGTHQAVIKSRLKNGLLKFARLIGRA